MKNTTYICDRCGLEEKSKYCPEHWHLLTRAFSDGKANVASSDGTRTYCPDCAEFIGDLFDSFKVLRFGCGSTYVHRDGTRMECDRLRGHKRQHFSSLGCWHWNEEEACGRKFGLDEIGVIEKTATYAGVEQFKKKEKE